MTPPLLSIDSLTKAYPGVVANDAVSLEVRDGEVHALLGENGAGKSTLVKMIYGLVKPDSGTMRLRGAPYAPADPNAARKAGVAMVFQHFSLFDAMSVAENVALGMASRRACAISRRGSARCRRPTGCRSTPSGSSAICRRANVSGSRSSAACCRTRAC